MSWTAVSIASARPPAGPLCVPRFWVRIQILKLYSRILTTGGYEVLTENSSQRAMQALENPGQLGFLEGALLLPLVDQLLRGGRIYPSKSK